MDRDRQEKTAVREQEQPVRTPPTLRRQGKAWAQVADVSGKALGRMVEAFMKLPGIGRKSAERLAFAVLGMPKDEAAGIAQAILDLKNNSRYCSVCSNITEEEICGICRDE